MFRKRFDIMWQPRIILIVFTLGVLVFSSAAFSQKSYKIRGIVSDVENQPIRNVWVRVYRDTDEIAQTITDSNGRYEIEFKRGKPITLVRYDHLMRTDFERVHSAMVNNISGKRNHRINKIMPGWVGHHLEEKALLEILSTYEYFYIVDRAGDLNGTRLAVYQRYLSNISMMKHLSSITKQRYTAVLELYSEEDSEEE